MTLGVSFPPPISVSRHKTEWLEGELSPKGSVAWVLPTPCHVLWCCTMARHLLTYLHATPEGMGPPRSAHQTSDYC